MSRDLKDQNPTVWVLNLLDINAQPQSLNQTGLRSFEIKKSPATYHRARQLIRYAQDHSSTAFIGEGDTVLHQSFKVKISPCLFELQMLVFLVAFIQVWSSFMETVIGLLVGLSFGNFVSETQFQASSHQERD